jgi:hypothetical protein
LSLEAPCSLDPSAHTGHPAHPAHPIPMHSKQMRAALR